MLYGQINIGPERIQGCWISVAEICNDLINLFYFNMQVGDILKN